MGNTLIQGSVGVRETKGKVQVIYRSHSPPGTGYIILLCMAKKPPDQRNRVKEKLDKID